MGSTPPECQTDPAAGARAPFPPGKILDRKFQKEQSHA